MKKKLFHGTRHEKKMKSTEIAQTFSTEKMEMKKIHNLVSCWLGNPQPRNGE